MPNLSYTTFTVRNLPLGTTREDVFNLIESLVPAAQPLVGAVICEPTRPLCYTTATIRRASDSECKAARDKLNGSTLYPTAPTSSEKFSKIIVSQEFLGVTTLVEDKDAQFDFYFVHGLGGHAFNTWTADKAGYPQMWPRDFLPNDVRARPCDEKNPTGPKLRGRFSTIGYQAKAIGSWSATTTIEKVAENLLIQIKTDRPEGSSRPLYFACHSLGGLVACQALIRAVEDNDAGPHGPVEDYKKIFYRNGECLVKGIFFFGTPFTGSKLADYASKIVKFLNGNTAIVNNLKDHAENLSVIVSKFNQLRYQQDPKIPVLIAYEMQPVFMTSFITRADSATGPFNDQPPLGLNGDHRTMIKFENNQDPGYRNVSEHIIRMIQSTLPGPPYPNAALVGNDAPAPFVSKPLPRASTTSSLMTLPPPYVGSSTSRPNARPPPFSSCSEGMFGGPDHVESSDPYHWIRRDSKFHDSSPPSQPTEPLNPNNIPISRLSITGVNDEPDVSNPENTSPFKQLSQFDTVFLLDDSGSMNIQDCEGGTSRWQELIQSMRYTVDTVCHYDKNGVDVHFLFNDAKDETEIRDGQRVMDLLTNEVSPDQMGGGTFLQDQLWALLTKSVDRFEYYRRNITSPSRPKRPKRLNLIVITDGAADDKEEVENTIVDAAQRLDSLQAPKDQVGIQFLQIGQDEQAGKWLELLDDSLHTMYKIRDIVDTRPWNSPEVINKSFRTRLEQILLGAVSRSKDSEATSALQR